jgi:hypothetical protein
LQKEIQIWSLDPSRGRLLCFLVELKGFNHNNESDAELAGILRKSQAS